MTYYLIVIIICDTVERDVLRVHADYTTGGPIRLRRLHVHRRKQTRHRDFGQSVDRLLAPRPTDKFPDRQFNAQQSGTYVVARF